MGLLVAFFVMLVAFSNQDQKKLQIVAGSMREAFGVQTAIRYSGIIEIDGLPTRPRLKNAAQDQPEGASATPTPDEKGRNSNIGARLDNDGDFALASASLRQAMQDMPEIAEAVQARHDRGDQAGSQHRARRPERQLDVSGRLEGALRAHAPAGAAAGAAAEGDAVPRLDLRPHRGEQAAGQAGLWAWELSADRANAVRRILEEEGVPTAHFFMVAGRADTQPLFPDDPFVAANRRVTITLMREAPPMPGQSQALISGISFPAQPTIAIGRRRSLFWRGGDIKPRP